MNNKYTESQKQADRRWIENNKEHASYLRSRSSARSFIRNKATPEDLEELEKLIINKRRELEEELNMLKENEVKELFKNLSIDFKIAVEKYRLARDEKDINNPYFDMSEEEEEKYYLEEKKRKNTINTSKDYINITREEYWQNIIKAKIEVIGAIGGFELMQDFSRYLRQLDDNDKKGNLMLESAFVYYADGICGWCR